MFIYRIGRHRGSGLRGISVLKGRISLHIGPRLTPPIKFMKRHKSKFRHCGRRINIPQSFLLRRLNLHLPRFPDLISMFFASLLPKV